MLIIDLKQMRENNFGRLNIKEERNIYQNN